MDFPICRIQCEDLLKKHASYLYSLMRGFCFLVYQFARHENREIDKFYLIDDRCCNKTRKASKVGKLGLLHCYKECILICLKAD